MMNLKSGYPYWLIKNGLPYNYPKLAQNIQADVVIIGGGITGALCAHELINAGINCIVVDGRTIGLGSTCASTSLLQYELDKPLHELSALIGKRSAERAYILCGNAIDRLNEISTTVNYKDFELKKSLYYAAFKKDTALLQQEYKARKSAGFTLDLLNEKDIKEGYGFKAPLALLSHKGACVNAYLLAHNIHQYNINKGCGVYDRTTVSEITYLPRSVKLLTTDGFTISAKKVINASGYEIEHFIQKKIVTLHATYALASENIGGADAFWKENAMIWNTADPYLYMRTTSDRRIMVGGRDEPFYNPARRDKLLKQKTKQLTKDFQQLFPHQPMIPEFSWTGTFGITKDALPFIGVYKKYPHTYFALGFGGNGITFSTIAAQLICEQIKGTRNRDLALFKFDRV
ncbi:MAG: FAD-dependent oxidoreductase [Bacteroidota bacterium]